MLEKLALLKIALCNGLALSMLVGGFGVRCLSPGTAVSGVFTDCLR
jgi:hypothetical protein